MALYDGSFMVWWDDEASSVPKYCAGVGLDVWFGGWRLHIGLLLECEGILL